MKWQHWSVAHFAVLAITAILSSLFIWIAKNFPKQGLPNRIGYTLGTLLLLNSIGYIAYRIEDGFWEVRYDLPMEFCDWAFFVTTLALFTHNRTMAELSYFWVLIGSIQALITPNLQEGFPHLSFFLFFIGHSGLAISALYLTFGLNLKPEKGAVLKTIIYSELYFITALILDYFLDANYGYLRYKPSGGSLLDYLGEWPMYLISIQAIGVVSILTLNLPFFLRKSIHDEKQNSK